MNLDLETIIRRALAEARAARKDYPSKQVFCGLAQNQEL